MPDTTTPSPPPPTGAEPDLDASVEAMVSGARPTRARESARAGEEPEAGEPSSAHETLDAVLAETARELAAAESSGESSGGNGEDFDDFADPSAVLEGEAATEPKPDAAAASPPGAGVQPNAAGPEPVAAESENAGFQDAASVLEEVSRELEYTPAQDEPTEETKVEEPPAEPPAPSPEPEAASAPVSPAEPEPVVPKNEGAQDGIEELDQVLAADAEHVLATAGDTPRIAASAVAPEDEVGAVETAPAPAPAAPPAVQPSPPTPIAAPATAPASPPAPEAPREPKPKRSLRPVFARLGSLSLAPLVRVNGRLSHTARQTIGYAAIITLFNCTWVWGYVLLRGPGEADAAVGEGSRFVKPGDPEPHNDGGHGAKADAKPDNHGKASASKKEDGGHGSASKKSKEDDGHGSGAKASNKPKKPTKKGASAGHH